MGGMPTGGIKSILTDSATPTPTAVPEETQVQVKWKAFFQQPFNASRLTYDWLKANAGAPYQAIYLGYSIGGVAHINVIGYYDFEGTPLVWVMEPWDGRFKLRDIKYYQGADRSFFAVPMG